MNIRYYLFLGLIFLPMFLTGQELIIRSVEALEDINIEEMIQSDNGELLILESQRLLAFDGYEMSEILKTNEESGHLKTLFKQGQKIYLGTAEGYLLIYEYGVIDTIEVADDAAIKEIIAAADNKLLISTDGSGVVIFDSEKNEIESLSEEKDLDFVNDMIYNDENYFFATDRGLYSLCDSINGLQKLEIVGNKIITDIILGDENHIYFTEFEGDVSCFNLQTGILEATSLGERVKVTDMEYINGRLYASSNKGLYLLDRSDDNGLRSMLIAKEAIKHLLADDECNLWLGADDHIDCASLYFSRFESPIGKEVHSLALFDSHLYIGSDSTLMKWDFRSGNRFILDRGLNITCMDHVGSTLVAGTYDTGVRIYDTLRPQPQVLGVDQGLSDNTVLALEVIDKNHLIVSTLGGVNRLRSINGSWQVEDKMDLLDRYYILSIHSEEDGTLWFGTDKKGVVRYRAGRVHAMDSILTGEETGSILSISHRGDRFVWMISEDLGLIRFEGNGLELVESPHGEWDRYTSLVPLISKRFLLIGEKEVSIFNPENQELIQFNDEFELERGTSFLNNYAVSDKRVFFEHNANLYEFKDDHDNSRTHSLTDLVTVKVNLEVIDTTHHDFSETQNNFQFTYRGILFRSPRKVRYSYRLHGFDSDWRTTRDRQVAYPHLDPGKYEFQLRSSHDLFQSDAEVVSYPFEIHRRFYNYSWFRLLMLLVLLSLVYWLNRRRRKAKELSDKLALISTETKLLNLRSQLNPHFLFNVFNTVIGLIEEDQERSIAYVEKLTDFYRLVLEIGDAELITVELELEMLRAYVHLLSERFGDALVVQIPDTLEPSLVPPMCLQLLVENAVKHNVVKESEPLKVIIEELSDSICVMNQYRPRSSVKDSMGIGLKNLKERYRILAQKEIMIEKGDGLFRVYLPKIPMDNSD